MPITGNSRDLSLIDLIQANVLVRNLCRITVAAPAGTGVIYLADGTVVHASYGSLEGRDAFFALVAAGDVFFQVETGFKAPRRTVLEKWENLALEAMRLLDEGKVPMAAAAAPAAARPVPVTAPAPPAKVAPFPQEVPARPAAALPQPAARPRASQRRSPVLLIAAAVAVLGLGAGAYFMFAGKAEDQTATSAASAAPALAPVEATDLTGPGDRQPTLVHGPNPPSPLPDLAVRPTIVCRILIDVEGKVQQAQVYQSRLDLARFEEAALQAVRGYRFTPALRARQPVPVWINWPVSFE